MKTLALIAICSTLHAAHGLVTLMPELDIGEHWTVEGKTHLRSKRKFRNFILKAEWRFQQGWGPRPGQHPWPNAGFFIHAREIKDRWPVSLDVQGYFGQAGSLFGVRGSRITGAKRGPFGTDRPPFGWWDK